MSLMIVSKNTTNNQNFLTNNIELPFTYFCSQLHVLQRQELVMNTEYINC